MENNRLEHESYKELKPMRLRMQNSPEAESDDEPSEIREGLRLGTYEKAADVERDPPLENLPLLKAALRNDWKEAKEIISRDRAALRARVSGFGQTVLHVAVCEQELTEFSGNLLAIVSESDLNGLVDDNGDTPLHCAASAGNIEAAMFMVRKYPALLQATNHKGLAPIAHAAMHLRYKTVSYLWKESMGPFEGRSGVLFVNLLVQADFYDIAYDVLESNRSLAVERDEHGSTILQRLAEKPEAFEHQSQFDLLDSSLYVLYNWLYEGRNVETPRIYAYKNGKRTEAIQLLELSVSLVTQLTNTSRRYSEILKEPLFSATRLGNFMFVEEVIRVYPNSVWFKDDCGRTIFHLAVIHRHKRICKLLYGMRSFQQVAIALRDKEGNNILHLAAKLGPSNETFGAAHQMQQELQWFQRLERIVPPSFKHEVNNKGKSPRKKFTEEHDDLLRDAERWMKDSAGSYAFVSALVVTVIFAAAFTVPGGNNQQDGFPIFINEISFKIFEIANALALYSSATSLLLFLHIINFRCGEKDFLKELPRKISSALFFLFFSIAAMLVAFSSSLYLLLSHQLKWKLLPLGCLAFASIVFPVHLQAPTFMAIYNASFSRDIFQEIFI